MSRELERRVVQPSEYDDVLAEVETYLRDIDSVFVRVTVEPVTAEKHAANVRLAELVDETDWCLNCQEPVDEGGFCGYQCFTEWGADDA